MLIFRAYDSTANGKGTADIVAAHAVNGYMAFLLFSVAGLACMSSSPILTWHFH
jgi:hypothetical protein